MVDFVSADVARKQVRVQGQITKESAARDFTQWASDEINRAGQNGLSTAVLHMAGKINHGSNLPQLEALADLVRALRSKGYAVAFMNSDGIDATQALLADPKKTARTTLYNSKLEINWK